MGSSNGEQPPKPPRGEQPGDSGQALPGATARMEEYVRLHAYIEDLRAEKRPRPPKRLSAEDASAYQMAALFHAAAPGASEPDPAFVASLRARLDEELTAPRRRLRIAASHVSRRHLLARGLGATAAAVLGAAAGAAIERQVTQPEPATALPLVPAERGVWLAVAPIAEIPVGAVKRFATASVVGYLRHTSTGFQALSGVCTHMGCLLQWNGAERTFDCPCHGGRFTADGKAAPQSPVAYRPLPSLPTKVESGSVWVLVARAESPETPGKATPDTYDAHHA